MPQYDTSDNQTSIKTATDGSTVVECGYDYQGRRYMKKVTVNSTVTSHERYLYRGYLQIVALDMLNNRNVLRTLLWDPLEPIATRPLALVQNAALYCYGTDFNKNVTEVFDGQRAIAAAYDYSPYGAVAKTGNLDQPVQWSGEMNDEELALVYYNYRCYNPVDGRWINRDPIAEQGGWNLYEMLENNTITFYDEKGLAAPVVVCGGVAVGASTYTAANMMGLSVCACLATPACRELIVKLTKETLRRACIEGCHLAYDIQAVSCGLLLSARSRALCYERAAEDCASCIQECNRATR